MDIPDIAFHGECIYGDYEIWMECIVLPKHIAAVYMNKHHRFPEMKIIDSSFKFRPIKSDREKAIEAALSSEFCFTSEQNDIRLKKLLSHWYDAGLLRPPEDK